MLSAPATPPSDTTAGTPPSRAGARVWTGRILSGFVSLFLAWDAGMKLVRHPMAIEGTATLGYDPAVVFPIGVVAAILVLLYVVPRTAVLGAVLMTGYLGGAIATHVRVGNPLFSHTLFPIYVAAMLWGGLALRDARVMAMLGPARRP